MMMMMTWLVRLRTLLRCFTYTCDALLFWERHVRCLLFGAAPNLAT